MIDLAMTNTAVTQPSSPLTAPACQFRAVFSHSRWHDAFYKFLQNIYRLYPEDRFHTLIKTISLQLDNDEAIYRRLQRELPTIKPFMADLTLALPSLFKQKKEILYDYIFFRSKLI